MKFSAVKSLVLCAIVFLASATTSVAEIRPQSYTISLMGGGYSFDDDAPLERWYRLGGFTRLSGLAPDQLSGRHSALASLALYRRLNDISFLPAYAGLTLETGNTWNLRREIGVDDLRYSGSLFVGAETPLGPVYFAVGYSDGGEGAVYFYLGNPFRPNEVD